MRRRFAPAEREVLLRVKRAVLKVEPQVRVILYGSRARGGAHPDSDWDLLVLLEGAAVHRRVQRVRDRVYDLELALESCPVLSTMVRSTEEWASPLLCAMPFHANVEREGIALCVNRHDL